MPRTRAVSASREYNLTAVTLGSRDFGEKDIVITLFSLELGKLHVSAKGTKKTVSSLRGAGQLFSIGECQIVSRRGSDLMTEWTPVESFPGIKNDLKKLSLAGYIARFISETAAEGHPDPALFRIIENIFFVLQSNSNYDIIKLAFEWGYLETSGQAFETGRCVSCGSGIKARETPFDTSEGGVLCPDCSKGADVRSMPKLNSGALRLGRMISEIPSHLSRGPQDPAGIREAISAIDSAAAATAGRDGGDALGRIKRAMDGFLKYHVSDKCHTWYIKL